MKISGIYSLRKYKKQNYRDIVYEWEDDISNLLFRGGGITELEQPSASITNRIIKKMNSILPNAIKSQSNQVKLAFCMTINEIGEFGTENILPVIIDLWPDDIEIFKGRIKKACAVVTSFDMWNYVKKDCPNVIYMPLCISDKWLNPEMPSKENVIVQMGRRNPVLHEYALEYCLTNSSIEYIYADYNQKSKQLTYFSNQKGIISTPAKREEYMKMLRDAKICLLSSPGIDNTRPMAKGIDYPTPRFYETAINYCHMLSRYEESHVEFQRQGISSVCKNIKNYQQFKYYMDEILLHDAAIDKVTFDDFIERHITRTWIKQLLSIVNAM